MTFYISLLSVLRMSEKILPVLYLHKEEVMQQSLFGMCSLKLNSPNHSFPYWKTHYQRLSRFLSH